MVLILASTNILSARIAAACFGLALLVVLFVAKNVRVIKADTFSSYIYYAIHKFYCLFVHSSTFIFFSLNGSLKILISVLLLALAVVQPVDTSWTLYW